MNIFPVQIFPEGGLSSSVITTVWVGVFVICYFNLRFGWVLSGLVVPGYLVPLLLAKPWSALVVIIEGCLTYLFVIFYSEYLSRWGKWSNFFGRDRFFALLLTNVLVRIILDGWLLPIIGEYVNTQFNILFDYRNNLHSFGLIVGVLIANNFWKTGILRGIGPLFVNIGLTYCIVRFFLMEFTNFNIGSLSYVYSDIAGSILASPKSYIVLIVTAFLASRMNLLYGWDFNGILIPSLIALQWYQPEKILSSFIEATIILIIASRLIKMPFFAKRHIEGARKLLLFFNVSFIYKMILSFFLIYFFPLVKISDYYGFGYLLPTLIAIKMYDKDIYSSLTRATLQVSIFAVIIASVIGFSLTLFPNMNYTNGTLLSLNENIMAETNKNLIETIDVDKLDLYKTRHANSVALPQPFELDIFSEALKNISNYVEHRSEESLIRAASLLKRLNYSIEKVQDSYLYLKENAPKRGWGLYVFSLKSLNKLLVEVPAPMDERNTLEVGIWLFQDMKAQALAIAGSYRNSNIDGSSDVLNYYQTLYQVFHHTLKKNEVLQIRGYTADNTPSLNNMIKPENEKNTSEQQTALWVKSGVPPSLNLVRLKQLVDKFDIKWGSNGSKNIQRDDSRRNFSELILNRDSIRKVFSMSSVNTKDIPLLALDKTIDGYLQEWLFSSKDRLAANGTNAYVPAKQEELLYFDDEIITPLIKVLSSEYKNNAWSTLGLEELHKINTAAIVFNYEIIRYHHLSTGKDYLILSENEAAPKRKYWGTYVFRLGHSEPYVVEVPRPIFEANTFEFSVSLFEVIQAQALLIGGATPYANTNYSSDIIRSENKVNIFNLLNQVLLRENSNLPMMTLQIRALSIRDEIPLPPADIVLALDTGNVGKNYESTLTKLLINRMEKNGLTILPVDGRVETAGYEVGFVPQSLYIPATQNKQFGIMWLSPLLRSGYRLRDQVKFEMSVFNALGISTFTGDAYKYITSKSLPQKQGVIDNEFKKDLKHYLVNQDMVVLENLKNNYKNYQFERVVDITSGQSFLFVYSSTNELLMLANLFPRQFEKTYATTVDKFDRKNFNEFLGERAIWIELWKNS